MKKSKLTNLPQKNEGKVKSKPINDNNALISNNKIFNYFYSAINKPIYISFKTCLYISFIFHILVIIPILFKFYELEKIEDKENTYIIYLDQQKFYEPIKQSKNQDQKTGENFESIAKNKNLLANKSNSTKNKQKNISKITKNYEEKMSRQVSFVLENSIAEDSKIEGNFVVEFIINRDGSVAKIGFSQESDDAISNKMLLDILRNIKKFDPIPEGFPEEVRKYRFSLPVLIED